MRLTQHDHFNSGSSSVLDPPARECENEKCSELSESVCNIARELRIPLAAILASAQSALAFSVSDPRGGTGRHLFKEELDMIVSEARNASETVERLLGMVDGHPFERQEESKSNSIPSRPVLLSIEKPAVLLVDDDPGIRKSVGRYLKLSGYDVDVATSGRDAATMLRERRYDAIVSDLRMPELSGEELFELLTHEFPDMAHRVAFTSGDLMRDETNDFVSQSGCPALHKPYDLADLLGVIRELCDDEQPEDKS